MVWATPATAKAIAAQNSTAKVLRTGNAMAAPPPTISRMERKMTHPRCRTTWSPAVAATAMAYLPAAAWARRHGRHRAANLKQRHGYSIVYEPALDSDAE